MRGVVPPPTHTSSWRGALFGTGYIFMAWYLVQPRDSFTFTYVKYIEQFHYRIHMENKFHR